MTLQVIGVGFGRTGTLSLKQALENRGFAPCEHMSNLAADLDRIPLWLEAARRKEAGAPIDWEPLFAGYQATADWPGTFFWRELVAAYPDARVILTVRDPDRWYDSAAETILRSAVAEARGERPKSYPPEFVAIREAMKPLLDAVLFNGAFQGRAADREFATEIFTRHNAMVQAEVPAERLLVYEVAEGWEPLCDFLGVPVPVDEPFPRVNDAATFRARVGRFNTASGETVSE
ncbi:MAG: sulfotransferase family protein [Chloroflexota bacterium]|nr:sulfotransferase family protein [Chloroflexota bacterium]